MRKWVAVTGAAGGIGTAIVERLLQEGHSVIAIDLQSIGDGPELRSFVADLTDPASVPAILSEVLNDAPLSGLVNGAGVAWFDRDGSISEMRDSIWHDVLAANLETVRLTTKAALPYLLAARSASVVHIASLAGLGNLDDPLDAYQVSKAGVVSLSRSLAVRYGPNGLRSNTICPGAILTPMIEHLYRNEPERQTRMEDKTPLRRLGTPADIANAVSWLLSEDSSFVTGVDLVIDGGWRAQLR